MILYPAVDIKAGAAVRLVQGDMARETRYDDNPETPAMRWEQEGASWLHGILCNELHEVISDQKLDTETRRDYVLKFAARITQAMPNHEIAGARDSLRSDEDQIKGKALTGEISNAQGSGSRPLQADAPRRRTAS